jgi:hypothetical protein
METVFALSQRFTKARGDVILQSYGFEDAESGHVDGSTPVE